AGDAIEGNFADGGAHLVGDGDEGGPLGRAGAGAADDLPADLAGIGDGIVDGKARVGIGVVGDVGVGAHAGGLSGGLIGGRAVDLAGAATAAAPTDFGGVGAVGAGGVERGAADGEDAGRAGGPTDAPG